MTTPDELPDRVEKVADLIRTVFGREISKGQKAVDELNAEKATIHAEVSEAQTQLKQAQADLKATLAHLGKASDLVSLRYEAAEKQKTLAGLKAEIARDTAAAASAAKQRAAEEHKLTAVMTQLQDARADLAVHDTEINNIRTKLGVKEIRA
jgi:chromosome segregation ATPase